MRDDSRRAPATGMKPLAAIPSAVLAGLLATPSLYLIDKVLGLSAVPLYVACVAAMVAIWRSSPSARFAERLGEKRACILAVATLAALVIAFFVLYPIAKSGQFGAGSDADDALNKAARALMGGHFPYRQLTYRGNPITPMPGALLLASTFVLLGNGAYQIFLWLPAAFLVVRAGFNGSSGRALTFSWLVLAACPAVLHHLVTGIDYAANSIAVLVFALGLAQSAARIDSPRWRTLGWAALFGLSLSSRANFVLLVPLVARHLAKCCGWRWSGKLIAMALFAASVVTLPFFAYDPQGFSPLHTADKLTQLNPLLPHAAFWIPVAALALSLWLALRPTVRSTETFLRDATLVQAFVVLLPATLWAMFGEPRLDYTAFGELFLYFGLAWIAARSGRDDRSLDAKASV